MIFEGHGVVIIGGANRIGVACAWEFLLKGANVP